MRLHTFLLGYFTFCDSKENVLIAIGGTVLLFTHLIQIMDNFRKIHELSPCLLPFLLSLSLKHFVFQSQNRVILYFGILNNRKRDIYEDPKKYRTVYFNV